MIKVATALTLFLTSQDTCGRANWHAVKAPDLSANLTHRWLH